MPWDGDMGRRWWQRVSRRRSPGDSDARLGRAAGDEADSAESSPRRADAQAAEPGHDPTGHDPTGHDPTSHDPTSHDPTGGEAPGTDSGPTRTASTPASQSSQPRPPGPAGTPRRPGHPTPPPFPLRQEGPDGRPARRRDRHGRGLRGPLAPAGAPLSLTRQEQFEQLVLDCLERLGRRWAEELSDVEFAVQDVPDLEGWSQAWVPLGRNYPAEPDRPARIVVFRRTVETRARHAEEDLAMLVQDVLVEEIADLLGVDPDQVDPDIDPP